MVIFCVWLYRMLEAIDGEKCIKVISYAVAEKVKIWLLQFIK